MARSAMTTSNARSRRSSVPTYFAGIDLVPGNIELMDFEHDTPEVLVERKRPSGGMFFQRVANAIQRSPKFTTSLSSIARRNLATSLWEPCAPPRAS